MKIMGLRTYKDSICWALIDGTSRLTATVVQYGTLQIPTGERGASLAWVREEIFSLVAQEAPDCTVLCPAEGSTANNALIERAQVDGVVLEAFHNLKAPVHSRKSATIRAQFGAKSGSQLVSKLESVPAVSKIPKSSKRRDPIIGAIGELPG